jgi:hypothetical protein
MRRLFRVLVVTAVWMVALGLGASDAQAEERAETPRPAPGGGMRLDDITAGLRLQLAINKFQYKVGEPILIDLRLYNLGNKDAKVYFEMDREGWLVYFEIRDAKSGEPVYQSAPVGVSQRKLRDSHYVVLPSGSFVGRYYSLSRPGKDFGEGDYILQAAYTNTYELCLASMEFTEKEIQALGRGAYIKLWTGQVLSNAIPFQIKGKMSEKEKAGGKKSEKASRKKASTPE